MSYAEFARDSPTLATVTAEAREAPGQADEVAEARGRGGRHPFGTGRAADSHRGVPAGTQAPKGEALPDLAIEGADLEAHAARAEETCRRSGCRSRRRRTPDPWCTAGGSALAGPCR